MVHTRSFLPGSPQRSTLHRAADGVCITLQMAAYPIPLLTQSVVQPWGRIVGIRKDLEAGSKAEAEGGTGVAEKFWEWSEKQVKSFA